MIHGHGNDGCFYKEKIVADFSSNVSPWGTSPLLLRVLRETLASVGSYPEPNGESLARDLGTFHHCSSRSILPVNGATEAFYLIAQAFRKNRSLVVYPTFSEYEDACQIHQHQLDFASREQFLTTNLSNFDLVWLCNPNNPTGDLFEVGILEKLISNHPNVIFVVDEAYMDFIRHNTSVVPLISKYSNLLVVKSLTKNFCIPGLRLGYLIGNENVIEQINQGKMPWTVNTLAIEVGKYILENRTQLLPNIPKLLGYTYQLQETLKQIDGVEVRPSTTNFFLCRTSAITAADLKEELVSTYGILIRNADNFRGLDKYTFRVAAQLPERNQLLVRALNHILGNLPR